MPGLTIPADAGTSKPVTTARQQARPGSPARPPVSPITPPQRPAQLSSSSSSAATPLPPQPSTATTTSSRPRDFSHGRQTFAHPGEPDAVALPGPPPPEPISFDANPDVLAVKSAISILQLQRQRALADMQALARARAEALERPEAFVADLAAGRVGQQGPGSLSRPGGGLAGVGNGGGNAMDEDDDDDGDDGNDEEEEEEDEGGAVDVKRAKASPRAWRDLPRPQNVVRCPPVNWSQYAVVGESLDKLHAEQVAAPTQGVPAVIGPGGALDLRVENRGPEPSRLVGVAAPYVPGRDKLDKKPKGGRR